jgi:ankyrin repeat protein
MYLPSDDDCPEIVRALWDRDFSRAESLLAAGASLDESIDSEGDSPLHRAAECGDLEMISFFKSHGGGKALDTFDYIEHTPLMRAAARGQLDCVRLLIDCGSDVNARCEERAGNTAIRVAVRGGHDAVVSELLARGADPTIPGWMGISAVDQAFYEMDCGLDAPQARRIQSMLSGFSRGARRDADS